MVLKTNAELIDDALFRAGESIDGTSDYEAAALRYLNRAYRAIGNGGTELDSNLDEKWLWLKTEGTLTLRPRIATGTVSVTNDSDTITFSTSLADIVGYHFRVDDHADVFKISLHGGGTAATLDSVYTGPTESGKAYKAFKIDYDLANDIKELIGPFKVYQDDRVRIYGLELTELHFKWPLNLITQGVPHNFAMIDQDSVRFSHYGKDESTELIRVVYPYLRRPADLANDANECLIPEDWRHMISDWVAFYLMVDKNDDRASGLGEMARNNLKSMAKENRRLLVHLNRNYGNILSRPNHRTRSKGPIRTEGGFILG